MMAPFSRTEVAGRRMRVLLSVVGGREVRVYVNVWRGR